ncbi:redoxin domain-containing protein [Chitinophaga cymbidii]|uniref:Thioredoxin domain-containing protein n=1 Tax=Chitinophaga cymbidii TaxID=1096750 RepID=A0A512RDY5_9BACT|nr:redoxin domain-containing protein [Chitinophaga cymbidii]GEP93917.1 hypothetical protein CCY01nite_01770 [Chitinophaga cymbidii]
MRYLLCLFLLSPFGFLKAQSGWQKSPLYDTSGVKQHLRLPDNKMLVLVFLSPECPLCKRYAPRLAEVSRAFRREAVFVGIIPGQTYSLKAIKAYQRDYNIPFMLLKDESLAFSHSLAAQVTPEVFVLSPDGGILYRGLIDNGIAALGKRRTVTTEHYLADALMKKNTIRTTQAIGCMINDL